MRVLRNIVCVLLIGIGAALCSCGGVYAQLPTSDGTCPLPFDFMVDYSETTFGDGASHTHTYTHAFTAACIYIYIYMYLYICSHALVYQWIQRSHSLHLHASGGIRERVCVRKPT